MLSVPDIFERFLGLLETENPINNRPDLVHLNSSDQLLKLQSTTNRDASGTMSSSMRIPRRNFLTTTGHYANHSHASQFAAYSSSPQALVQGSRSTDVNDMVYTLLIER
jgi:hypothetical protein